MDQDPLQKVKKLLEEAVSEFHHLEAAMPKNRDKDAEFQEKVRLLVNDLNNAIQEVVGNLNLMRNHLHNPEKETAFLETASNSLQKVTQISGKLARMSAGGKVEENPPKLGKSIKANQPDNGSSPPKAAVKSVEATFFPEVLGKDRAKGGRPGAEPIIPIENPNGKKQLLMIVDDEEENAKLLSMVLTSKDYRIIRCSSGAEAVFMFGQNSHAVDLVLLDYIMPGMNGEETFGALKEINPDAKIFMITGLQDNADIVTLLRRGLIGVLYKPYSATRLLDQIEEILASPL